jgi:hypothetical protein
MFPHSTHFSWPSVAGLFYVLIALAFIIRTYEEGRTSQEGGPFWRAMGLLLCLAWPGLVALAGFEVMRQRRHYR